ncbi:MAG: hypothetical protein NXI00_01575 [Cytophagales bacterium]|nr:hypothetical protein [Cytophagales bacterium]
MIDFVNFWVNDGTTRESILIHPELDFNSVINHSTGEIKYHMAKYKNLEFIVTSSAMKVKGSLHYYFNGGQHNYNDFSISNLYEVLKDLENRFGIDYFNARLRSFEFGVNIRPRRGTEEILNSLLCYKYDPFIKMDLPSPSNGKTCKKSNYVVKVYDKSLQNKLWDDRNILRIELKVLKMCYVNTDMIFMLSDLLKYEKLNSLRGRLIRMIQNFLILEEVRVNNLSFEQNELLLKSQNPRFWQNLNPRMRNYYLKKYNNLIGKTETIKSELVSLVSEKSKSLIQVSIPL